MRKALDIGELVLGSQPALIVVDASLGFTDPDSPLGADFSPQIGAIAQLTELARQRGWPVIFTTVWYEHEDEAAVFRRKIPALNALAKGSRLAGIDPRLTVSSGDCVLRKLHASAFHGTELDASLRARNVDSLVICGFTTSGCVRATAVDALQYGYPAVVVEDAVADRDAQAHRANLYDLQAKYCAVLPLDQL